MQVTLPNRKRVTLENIATFGEFAVGDMKSGVCGRSVITFRGAYYDDRRSRDAAEWCASKFDPAHAARHAKKVGL